MMLDIQDCNRIWIDKRENNNSKDAFEYASTLLGLYEDICRCYGSAINLEGYKSVRLAGNIGLLEGNISNICGYADTICSTGIGSLNIFNRLRAIYPKLEIEIDLVYIIPRITVNTSRRCICKIPICMLQNKSEEEIKEILESYLVSKDSGFVRYLPTIST